ncbi:hypothetical protein TSAR_011211 [Trichomalopsis sarcophagae]|uniref:Uncharacterized protein n=1 Tax=Trichomalopsis sarcophagae TaxID=543379 RepID=A0A232FAL4_9HYME|nr:hypothetical protein TSAR_011211 [Trichomalopsis sarcophagae]
MQVTIAVLLATAAFATALNPLDLVEDLVASPSSPESASLPPPPVKLDKNLRRALLKALVDLEAESAEQQTDQPVNDEERSTESVNIDENKYDFLEISKQKSSSFSFDGFPSEDETPSEDKLQNSSFIESDKYAQSDAPEQPTGEQQPPKDYTKGVQVHHVVPSEKASAIYETKPGELLETVESRSIGSTSSPASSSSASSDLNLIQKSMTFAPITETLSVSASGSIASAAANSLVAPRPTAATNLPKASNHTSSKIPRNKEESAEDVKIFQAPLVAAFTVQQDERGIPKSVVPLYKSSASGQPLSLQEQLDFKQRLLEKQLAQLQAQQSQQTQFLLRQRQAYEEQLRQKQQQDYFLQEQRRLHEQQRLQRVQLQQQQQQQFIQQLPRFQQLPQPQQQQTFKATNNVQFQPSLSLEVPSVGPAQPFQQGPVRTPLQQQQQQQPQTQFFPPQQQQAPLARFNRQEAFNSVGNFGFNNVQQQSQPSFVQQRSQEQQSEAPFRPLRQQYRLQLQSSPGQSPPQHTPARQIQELLYQSGIANDLQGAGTRHLEDINIVSKVLALNVGALPGKHGFQQFSGLKKK